MLNKIILVSLLFYHVSISAQHIEHSSIFRNAAGKHFRFHYDNDFFTKSDEYYTQGITFEYSNPSIKYFPISGLLINLPRSYTNFGFAINLLGYTPTSIQSETILYGDRPYASAITFKTFNTSADSLQRMRLSSAVSIGILGPGALGKEIQAGIHRWLDNPIPKGWDTQVQNDIILNYQVNFDKALHSSSYFLMNLSGEARAGTLNNRFGIGINIMTGNFNDPYSMLKRRKVEYYFYGQVKSNMVGYDATLQGGIFNRNNPYILAKENIKRLTAQADAGIILNYKKLLLSYTQSILTKEFTTGKNHRWGGISLGYLF